jgi:ERCC4-type nuclease
MIYAPSSIELSSLMMPSMKWFKQNFKSYNKLCESIGLFSKFDLEDEVIEYGDLKKEAKIIIDTREQRPFQFEGYPVLFKGLTYGDYGLEPNKFKVFIERKELKDFISTLGANYDRFCREINRAKKERAYLVVLVESDFSTILSFDHIPYIKRITKVTPDFITHNIRTIMQKYNNIQFLFCKNKDEARNMVLKIFGMKKRPSHFDLQYNKSMGRL